MNVLLTVTNKFIKWVKLVPGKNTYNTKDWTIIYYDYVVL